MTVAIDQTNTRTVILEKARELFLTLGYQKTTMRMIAQAAGVSTGPLYFHFKNKAEVFFHICSQAYDFLTGDFQRVADEEGHAGLRLRNIYGAYVAFYHQKPQLYEIMHLAINPNAGIDLPKGMQKTLFDQSQELILIMEMVIRDGIARGELRPIDPQCLALYLYSTAEGVFAANHTGIFRRSGVELERMIETAIEVVGIGMVNQQG